MKRGLTLLYVAVALAIAAAAAGHPAWGIVVTRGGEVYFTDLETVWRIDRGGGLTIAVGGAVGRHVHELGIDAADNIYGVNGGYSDAGKPTTGLWRRDAAGRVVYLIAPTERFPRGAGVWRDGRGTTFAVELDNHLKRETLLVTRDAAGRVGVRAGSRYGFADGTGTAARFRNIVGMAVTPEGEVYLTDGFAVRRVSPAGVVTTLAQLEAPDPGCRAPLFGGLFGIAVTKTRTVFVADFKQRRVVRIEPGQRPQVVLRADPPWSPVGVAVSDSGEVYVMEIGYEPPSRWLKPRVRRLARSGAVSTVAVVPSR